MGDLVKFTLPPKLAKGERPRRHLSGCPSGDFGPCDCEERRKQRDLIQHAKSGEPQPSLCWPPKDMLEPKEPAQ